MPLGNLGVSRGEAFLLSGRQFDQLQEDGRRLAIRCSDDKPIANIGFDVMADYLNSIYRKMTPTQANLIVELLRGTTQQQYTHSSQKSKSTVSQLASAGLASQTDLFPLVDRFRTAAKYLGTGSQSKTLRFSKVIYPRAGDSRISLYFGWPAILGSGTELIAYFLIDQFLRHRHAHRPFSKGDVLKNFPKNNT